jgi:UDP-N-acetylmuramate dehydrogenase
MKLLLHDRFSAFAQLEPYNTLGLKARCRWLAEVTDSVQLGEFWSWALDRQLPVFFLGDGSNVVFADEYYPGLVIVNRIAGFELRGEEVLAGGGESLLELIERLNARGLAGLESLYGIPGTLGGAIVGNAGAYGQEIGDRVVEVEVITPTSRFWCHRVDLAFSYRSSRFKFERNWFLSRCRLRLNLSDVDLRSHSEAILRERLRKYPARMKCPGSFFKNVPWETLAPEVRERIPSSFLLHGKIPAGKLLESVGARGLQRGNAAVAEWHGNLFVNLGEARAEDLLGLADELAARVLDRFGIQLEPEVVIVGEARWPHLKSGTSLGL